MRCHTFPVVGISASMRLEHPRFLDIATLDVSGRTALHIAAQHGHADVCKVGGSGGEFCIAMDISLAVAYFMPSGFGMKLSSSKVWCSCSPFGFQDLSLSTLWSRNQLCIRPRIDERNIKRTPPKGFWMVIKNIQTCMFWAKTSLDQSNFKNAWALHGIIARLCYCMRQTRQELECKSIQYRSYYIDQTLKRHAVTSNGMICMFSFHFGLVSVSE
jgi:hypothetical protein